MAITPLPTPPSTSDRDNFETRADAFLLALPTFATEVNTAAEAMNLLSLSTISSTSHSAATGSKTFTVQSGKSFLDGMWVTIADDADPTKQMVAIVTSYSGTTLQVNVQWHSGFAGSLADWIIAQCPPYNSNAINDVIIFRTSNLWGSTDTHIRAYTTLVANQGSSFSYTTTAGNGTVITINATGLYSLSVSDHQSMQVGFSKNSNQLTTTLNAIDNDDVLMLGSTDNPTSVTAKLTAGDLIRVHSGLSPTVSADTNNRAMLVIKRIW